MRRLVIAALVVGMVQPALGQSEIIIRRPGQKDQVIPLNDSLWRGTLSLRFDSAWRARNGWTSALVDSQLAQLRAFKLDSLAPSKMLAFRGEELPKLASTWQQLADKFESWSRQPRFGISVAYRPQDTDRYGAYVVAVTPGGPAAKAGIMSGDIITKIDGKSLTDRIAVKGSDNTNDNDDDTSLPYIRLTTIISQLRPGKAVAVELRRGTQTQTVQVTPVEENTIAVTELPSLTQGFLAPAAPMRSVELSAPIARNSFTVFSDGGPYRLGWSGVDGLFANLELAPVNEKLGSYFGVAEGVLVVNTNEDAPENTYFVGGGQAFDVHGQSVTIVGDSIHARSYSDDDRPRGTVSPARPVVAKRMQALPIDLQSGDVIVSIDGRKVTTPSQLMRIVSSYDRGDEFKLQYMRDKHAETLTVKMP